MRDAHEASLGEIGFERGAGDLRSGEPDQDTTRRRT